MKGILMFDNLNDLVFFKADQALSSHLWHLAIKDGLAERESTETRTTVSKNIVVQLFSPLIASYKVMQSQFGNQYTSIECEDGVLLVFNELLNYIAVGVSSVEKEDLETVQQQISVFFIFVKMLYGPSLKMMKNLNATSGRNISKLHLLSQLIDKWSALRANQQMFLVEAIERLLVNEDVTSICVNLLQRTMEKIRSTHKEGSFCHSFLVVDAKLLALYSSRNASKLSTEDLLLLIVIVQVLKNIVTEEKSSICSIPPIFSGATGGFTDSDQFFIPKLSAARISPNATSHEKGHVQNIDEKVVHKENQTLPVDEIKSLLVFLRSRHGLVVPHIVFTVNVTNRITLVIINEICTKGPLSSCLSSLIETLNRFQMHQLKRENHHTMESVEASVKEIADTLKKLKLPEGKERFIRKIISNWEQLKLCGITEFLQSINENVLPPRLDASISSMCEILQSTFEHMIILPELNWETKPTSPDYKEDFIHLQNISRKKLKDFSNFLEAKAEQNITMSSYMTDFPGLIHFIYIDRSSDCLIAPTVVLKQEGHLDGMASLKDKIWKMVALGRQYVDVTNHLCAIWTENDLNFFYCIWFEDSTGRAIKPKVYPDLENYPIKGIVCGNFYKKLIEECFPTASLEHIFCYELFCVHLATTSSSTILEQSRRLSALLWEFTGAYRTSLDLL